MSTIKITVNGTTGVAEIDGARYAISDISADVAPLELLNGGMAILFAASATEITPDETRVRILAEIAEHLVGYEDE